MTPVWARSYSGGMMRGDREERHAKETFAFLRLALAAGKNSKTFQLRGPRHFKRDRWHYQCLWGGDIENFSGYETITYCGNLTFCQEFLGGIIMHQTWSPFK
jgi:hypothetical protein